VEYAFLSGLGLAAPAGLNAYLPLLIVALADRFTDAIDVDRPYEFIHSTWGIALLILLVSIEVIVDKIPGVDHLNDLLQTVLRPAAGAFLMMASNSDGGSLNPVVAMLFGLLAAGTVHAVKASARPAVTVSTGGLGNPLVSMAEDGVAAVTALVALVVPLLIPLFILAFAAVAYFGIRSVRRLSQRRLQKSGLPESGAGAASTTLRR